MNQNKTIFIVEDNLQVSDVLVTLLEGEGYNILGPVKDKLHFDKAIFKHHSKIDLILLDIELMNGENGISCVVEMLAMGKCIYTPILFVSGTNDQQTLDRVINIKNTVGFIVKPFHENELLTNVKMALAKQHDKKADQFNLKNILAQTLALTGTSLGLEQMLLNFGHKLKETRRDQKLTQAQIAEKLDINYRHYQDIESGKVNLRMETFLKIVNFLF